MINASPTGPATRSIEARPETPISVNAWWMPHTVPNRPTNGEVEPTIAGTTGAPGPSASATALFRRWAIQVWRSIDPSGIRSQPRSASIPASIVARAASSGIRARPASAEGASRKARVARRKRRTRTVRSIPRTMRTYQLAIDMRTRTPSVARATTSPWFHIAVRPLGSAPSAARAASGARTSRGRPSPRRTARTHLVPS